jgi:hypothetical protein
MSDFPIFKTLLLLNKPGVNSFAIKLAESTRLREEGIKDGMADEIRLRGVGASLNESPDFVSSRAIEKSQRSQAILLEIIKGELYKTLTEEKFTSAIIRHSAGIKELLTSNEVSSDDLRALSEFYTSISRELINVDDPSELDKIALLKAIELLDVATVLNSIIRESNSTS